MTSQIVGVPLTEERELHQAMKKMATSKIEIENARENLTEHPNDEVLQSEFRRDLRQAENKYLKSAENYRSIKSKYAGHPVVEQGTFEKNIHLRRKQEKEALKQAQVHGFYW